MRVQVAKIIYNGEYKIFDTGSGFEALYFFYVFGGEGYGMRKHRKKLGDFPTMAAALYNVYSMVQCNYSPV